MPEPRPTAAAAHRADPSAEIDARAVARTRIALFTLLAVVVTAFGLEFSSTGPPLPANDRAPTATTRAAAPPALLWVEVGVSTGRSE